MTLRSGAAHAAVPATLSNFFLADSGSAMSRDRLTAVLSCLAVCTGVAWLTASAATVRRDRPAPGAVTASASPADVPSLDTLFESRWSDEGITPADDADEPAVLRRLSLALHGTVPSLEEIRLFRADDRPDRLARWTDRQLADRRFADYWAERLARPLVGVEANDLVLFRRDRLKAWLADQLHADRPFDEVVRELIAAEGLWTGAPATNFVTAAINEGEVDRNKLAGRTVRAFLGQRIDCAQCHDHPFADWSQGDFEGLAAFYGRTRLTPAGIREVTTGEDGEPLEYAVQDRETLEDRVVAPRVPFAADRLDPRFHLDGEDRRRALAAWVTHPENRRFPRAVANRTWGLMFGRAWSEPVDDLPDPADGFDPEDPLDVLGDRFRTSGYSLKSLVRTIAASRPFRLDSVLRPDAAEADYEAAARAWAVFPLTRLRPEQTVGAMTQAARVRTVDADSHLFVRFLRYVRENDFVRDYGDAGELELAREPGTVPQALLRMNGELPAELADPNPLNATARIGWFADDPEVALETAFLCCLTREPTADERDALRPLFVDDDGAPRSSGEALADLYWALFNAPEFGWNH